MAEIDVERNQRLRDNPPPPPPITRPTEELASGYVYFIRAGNRVKIGFSTDIRGRIRSIQTGCPAECVLVKWKPGTVEDERREHNRYAKYWIKGEWFMLDGALARYLGRCTPVEPPKRIARVEEDFRL